MKIISWNINGYRSITGQNPSKRYDEITTDNKLFAYIEKSNPDIICLQETKAEMEQITSEMRFPKNYTGLYCSSRVRKGYSGVATFSKSPAQHQAGIGIEKFDNEGRVIISHYDNFSILNVYFPNGQKDDERLNYKLDFYDALFVFAKELEKSQPNIIVCGDYNTAHKEIDLARPKENEKISGFLPIERAKIDKIIALGFVDVFREMNQSSGQYTWWSNRGQARRNNVGWRIDYFFVTKNFLRNIKSCFIEPTILGSDHCPIILEVD